MSKTAGGPADPARVIRWQRIVIRVLLLVTAISLYKAYEEGAHDLCRLSSKLYKREVEAARERDAASRRQIRDLSQQVQNYEDRYGPLSREAGETENTVR